MGVNNVYTFLHADFEGIQFYTARWYGNLTKVVIEEDFFVNYEEEEDDKVLPVSELPLLVEQRVGGVQISYLPCSTTNHSSNLTSEDMADIWR